MLALLNLSLAQISPPVDIVARIPDGKWVRNCFIYATSNNRLCSFVDSESYNIGDWPIRFAGSTSSLHAMSLLSLLPDPLATLPLTIVSAMPTRACAFNLARQSFEVSGDLEEFFAATPGPGQWERAYQIGFHC
ncbi:hypothetical protein BKA70DRAFT_1427477 [Coprinopsis sp. MPI-PUGE-AT-0042]|nr:hypothetical protein BKA70DRAFT_1427477 [Coprinopsis sp. MPI-PUGE-AT-0042]